MASGLSKREILHYAYRENHMLFVWLQHGYSKCHSVRPNRYRETGQMVPLDSIHPLAAPVKAARSDPQEWVLTHTSKVSPSAEYRRRPIASFDDFLLTLDAWEYDLLCHRILFTDAFTASEDLTTSFVAGSYGSEKYGTDGAFGWMISNDSNKHSEAGMGPSEGWQMDSY